MAVILPLLLFFSTAHAASCCGGGSASSLVLSKFADSMIDISFDYEKYDGYFDMYGKRKSDPPGSDLRQYRLNAGYAKRIAPNWQVALTLPVIYNSIEYGGVTSSSSGAGDVLASFWYESFDNPKCVWEVDSIDDLTPAIYLGSSLTIPTGVSPYDSVNNSFHITGRGFFRLDLNAIIEKTIYPWTVSLLVSYGKYMERSVNREYGKFVSPYKIKPGDRRLMTLSGGYTLFLESLDTITATLAYSDLSEKKSLIDGSEDPGSGFRKKSISFTLAFSNDDQDRIYKFTWSRSLRGNGNGENFPITDIFTIGGSYVFN